MLRVSGHEDLFPGCCVLLHEALDLLDEGENGFLSDDDGVLAEKMVLLASDPVLRERLSVNAAEKASGINDVQTYKNTLSSWY